MQGLAEAIKKPVGRIHLLNHRGEPKVRPWETDYARQMIKDPRFGALDLSNIDVIDEFEDHNLIVNQASVLMAQRMAPGNLGTAGIGFLAVGTGYGTGSLQIPQAEDPTYTALRAEFIRKAITSWTFLNAAGAAVGSPPTGVGVLQFTTTFGPTEANAPLVEMGLFGGAATTATNSGTLFNYKSFPVWNKTAALNASLTIVWTITF